MKSREVIRRIESLGGEFVRQVGSHRRYKATVTNPDSTTGTAFTTVAHHPGKDIATGTLHSIQKDLEPAFGKGWLL